MTGFIGPELFNGRIVRALGRSIAGEGKWRIDVILSMEWMVFLT